MIRPEFARGSKTDYEQENKRNTNQQANSESNGETEGGWIEHKGDKCRVTVWGAAVVEKGPGVHSAYQAPR